MKNGIEVFDFKEEDEVAEYAAGKILDTYKNPSLDSPAFLKHQLLECASKASDVAEKEISTIACMDVDANECYNSSNNATKSVPLEMVREEFATQDVNACPYDGFQSQSPSHENDPCSKMDTFESKSSFTEHEARVSRDKAPSPGKSQSNFTLGASPSNSEPVNVKSDADGSVKESIMSSPTSNIAENSAIIDGCSSDNCFSALKMDIVNIAVDYIVYQDNYCIGCTVTFSCGGIKISGMPAYGEQESFYIERGIDDIIRIESKHFQRFGTVTVKFHMLPKDAAQDANAYGVEQLEFAVIELNWSRKLEEIASLNVKYLAISSIVHDMDLPVGDGADVLRQRPYFPTFDEAVEDVVYPKGDSDAVSISKRDFDLLQPETFINDTIIDFYIKYLKNQIPTEERHRFHFFNSFFFRKLADLDKDPSSASDGRAAFLRVQKWTRKVDIFGKDYVFIPVNFNLHWSLLVICHPGEVAGLKDEDLGMSLRVPCILHMDSIKGTHACLKNLVQSYLWEEWKARQKDTSEDLSAKFLNLRFVPLELPQQENSFDCGLFLLHYLELFLVEAPLNFSPFKINQLSKFLNVDWFPPAEASLKRTLIQRLISGLLENHSRELSSDDYSDELASCFPENNEKETAVQLVSERCTSAVACHGNLSSSDASPGIEINLLGASSVRNSECINDPGLALREFFEPGVAAGSLLAQCSSFDQSSYYRLNGAMSQQIEENAETGEPFVYLPSGDAIFQQMAGITPQAGSIPYSVRGFGPDPSWNPGISMQGEDGVSSPETSVCATDDSDVGIIENCPVQKDVDLCHRDKIDKQVSQSMESIECLTGRLASGSSEMLETPVTEVTDGLDRMHDRNEHGDPVSCQENPSMLHENGFHQHFKESEIANDDVVAVSDEKQRLSDNEMEKSYKKQTIGNEVMVELDEKQTVGDKEIAESDENQIIGSHAMAELDDKKTTGGNVMADSHEKQTIGGNVMAESDEKKIIGSIVVTEPDDEQKTDGNVMVDSDEKQTTDKGNVMVESDEKQTTDLDEQKAAKRRRITINHEGEDPGNQSEDLHLLRISHCLIKFTRKFRVGVFLFTSNLATVKQFLYSHQYQSRRWAVSVLFVILVPIFFPYLFGPLGRASPSLFSEWNAPKTRHLPFLKAALDRHTLSKQQSELWSPLPHQVWRPCTESTTMDSLPQNSQGYIQIFLDGGLNQQRMGICDAVAVAKILSATLVIPHFEVNPVWQDSSSFMDIFDVNHFIDVLRHEISIVKGLPSEYFWSTREYYATGIRTTRIKTAPVHASANWYLENVLPVLQSYGIAAIAPFSHRLAFDKLPANIQRLRCKVNFEALVFVPHIKSLGNTLVNRLYYPSSTSGIETLKERRGDTEKGGSGKFVVLHLRFDKDMAAHSACEFGGGKAERLALAKYRQIFWRGRVLNSQFTDEELRKQGRCPLTPEEIGLLLAALGFSNSTHLYLASHKVYGGEARISTLKHLFPLMEDKKSLASAEELAEVEGRASLLAAVDYYVSLRSDIFISASPGNMHNALVGHRSYLNLKTIRPDMVLLGQLFLNKSMEWSQFQLAVVNGHKKRQGQIRMRKERQSIYTYPIPDCMCQL